MNRFKRSTMSGLSRLDLHKRVKLSIIKGEITADEKNAAIEELKHRFNYDYYHIRGKLGKRYMHLVTFHYVLKGVDRYFSIHFNTGERSTLEELKRFNSGDFWLVDDYGQPVKRVI